MVPAASLLFSFLRDLVHCLGALDLGLGFLRLRVLVITEKVYGHRKCREPQSIPVIGLGKLFNKSFADKISFHFVYTFNL